MLSPYIISNLKIFFRYLFFKYLFLDILKVRRWLALTNNLISILAGWVHRKLKCAHTT